MVLKATGAILTVGLIIAATIAILALLRPTAFKAGHVARPGGPLTPSEQIALERARFDAQNAGRETGLKVAAGVGALAAALLAWGRIELSRAERRLERAEHLSERYSKAVEQLGHSTTDVQLGGIYSLEQLARDSPEHRNTVVEVLCAFVREHAGPQAQRRTTFESVAFAAQIFRTVRDGKSKSHVPFHRPLLISLAEDELRKLRVGDLFWELGAVE